jgi:hypothetical protein
MLSGRRCASVRRAVAVPQPRSGEGASPRIPTQRVQTLAASGACMRPPRLPVCGRCRWDWGQDSECPRRVRRRDEGGQGGNAGNPDAGEGGRSGGEGGTGGANPATPTPAAQGPATPAPLGPGRPRRSQNWDH